MNTDIRLKTTFPHHLKTKKLIKKLGFKGFYSLICLWCYTAVNRPKGILDNMTIEDIAIAADWDDDPELLIDSLIQCGFLEKTDDGVLTLHDWNIHNAYAANAQSRSSIAKINALIRWGKNPLASLLHHEDPDVRKEAARLLARQRHKANRDNNDITHEHRIPIAYPSHDAKNGNACQNARSDATGNAGSQSLDSQDFDANSMQTLCEIYAPPPPPPPSPSPSTNNSTSSSSTYLSTDNIGFFSKDAKNENASLENTTRKKVFEDNVLLTDKEYDKLVDSMGEEKAREYIIRLNDYIHQIGKQKAKKYKSHYHTILNWYRMDKKEIERRLKIAEMIKQKKDDEYFR